MKFLLVSSALCLTLNSYARSVLQDCQRLYETQGVRCIFAETENEAKEIYNANVEKVKNAKNFDNLDENIFGYTLNNVPLKESFRVWSWLLEVSNNILINDKRVLTGKGYSREESYLHEELNKIKDESLTRGEKRSYFILKSLIDDDSNFNLIFKDEAALNDVKLYCSRWGANDNLLNYVKVLEYGLNKKENISEEDLKDFKYIDEDAFKDADNLEEIELPDSIESVDAIALAASESLKTIFVSENWSILQENQDKIPDSIRSTLLVRDYKLVYFVNKGNIFPLIINKNVGICYKGGAPVNSSDVDLLNYENNMWFLDFSKLNLGIRKISGTWKMVCRILYNTKRQSINLKIPDSVQEIGNGCFKNCDYLREIIGGSYLKKIGDRCFSDTYLENIVLDQVEEIGSGCFYNCIRLKSVKIGQLERLKDCASLKPEEQKKIPSTLNKTDGIISKPSTNKETIVLTNNEKNKNSELLKERENRNVPQILDKLPEFDKDRLGDINEAMYQLEKSSKENASMSQKEEINECKDKAQESLGEIADLNTSKMLDKHLESYRHILGCFNKTVCQRGKISKENTSMSRKEEINEYKDRAPKPLKEIADFCFYGCKRLQTITLNGDLEMIGNSVFKDCGLLESITVPNSVMEIGDSCFENCKKLNIVNLSNSLKKLNSQTFKDCVSLKIINIPNLVREIGSFCFFGCENLQKVHLDNSPKKIGNSTFLDCVSLESIDIPNSVMEIGDSCFENCKKLNIVNLSNSLKKLNSQTFKDCVSLKIINIPNLVREIGSFCFFGCENLQKVNLKAGLEIGMNAFGGCPFEEEISKQFNNYNKEREKSTFRDHPVISVDISSSFRGKEAFYYSR